MFVFIDFPQKKNLDWQPDKFTFEAKLCEDVRLSRGKLIFACFIR